MTSRRYVRQLQAVILRFALYRDGVHADDALAVLPVPDGIHVNAVGRAFSGPEAAGLITATGFQRSRRKARHGGVSRRWRAVDVAGCRAYLNALAGSRDDALTEAMP